MMDNSACSDQQVEDAIVMHERIVSDEKFLRVKYSFFHITDTPVDDFKLADLKDLDDFFFVYHNETWEEWEKLATQTWRESIDRQEMLKRGGMIEVEKDIAIDENGQQYNMREMYPQLYNHESFSVEDGTAEEVKPKPAWYKNKNLWLSIGAVAVVVLVIVFLGKAKKKGRLLP